MDTSSLQDIEILARIAIIKEIAGGRGVLQALADMSDKFMDFGALVGEKMMAAKGTRH